MNTGKISTRTHTARVEHVWRTAIDAATVRRVAAQGADALHAATVALWESESLIGHGVRDTHTVVWTRNASPATALRRVSWSVLATSLARAA